MTSEPPAAPGLPADVADVLSRVDALRGHDDLEGAQRLLAEAQGRWPQDERVILARLDVLRRLGDSVGVRALAHGALLGGLRSSDLSFALGAWAEEHGGLVSASRSFARAARLAPDDPEPLVRLTRVLRRAGRPDLAERAVRRALTRLPEAAALHAALGYAFVDAHRPAAAATAFREAARLEPAWAVYREDLAYALVLAGRWREAAEAAQVAVKAAPKSERGWTALATSCARLGQSEAADRAYRQALLVARDPSRTQGNYGMFLAEDPTRVLEAGRLLKAAAEAHPDWAEVREALAHLGRPG